MMETSLKAIVKKYIQSLDIVAVKHSLAAYENSFPPLSLSGCVCVCTQSYAAR